MKMNFLLCFLLLFLCAFSATQVYALNLSDETAVETVQSENPIDIPVAIIFDDSIAWIPAAEQPGPVLETQMINASSPETASLNDSENYCEKTIQYNGGSNRFHLLCFPETNFSAKYTFKTTYSCNADEQRNRICKWVI